MKVKGHLSVGYEVTAAYIKGAEAVAEGRANEQNPFRPGCEYAQYDYGKRNEQLGYHDELELEL
jgi:hypothetical protein